MNGKLLFRFELSESLKIMADADNRIYEVREFPGRKNELAVWWKEDDDFCHRIYETDYVNENIEAGTWIKLDDNV